MLNSPLYHYLKYQLYSACGASEKTLGETFVNSVTDLGFVYVKFGQLKSNQSELHPDFINELKVLQDGVPVSDTVAPPSNIELLESCASGTVAQVYKGKTKDGKIVAVKLKRKNIDALFESDLCNLKWYLDIYLSFEYYKQTIIGWFTNNTTPVMQLKVERRELFKTFDTIANLVKEQTNFMREMEMMEQFYKIYKDNENIRIPRCYAEYSNNDCIVMDFIEGERLDRIPKERLESIYQTFVEFVILTPLVFNICHGDLHLGNIMAEGNKLVVLDYGIVYELEDDEMTDFFNLLETVYNTRSGIIYLGCPTQHK